MLDALFGRTSNQRINIIDPACGDGAFLQYAVEHGITAKHKVIGIDCDLHVGSHKRQANGFHLINQNGLLPFPDEKRGFDYVVGNPPYGTRLINGEESPIEIEKLKKALGDRYTNWRNRTQRSRLQPATNNLVEYDLSKSPSCPIEVLFLERFIQLASPVGQIAIVIPDGVLANGNLQHVRSWLSSKITINGVISLPRQTFMRTGTTAKTSLLLMTASRTPPDHLVFVVTAKDLNHELPIIASDFVEFVSHGEKGFRNKTVSLVEQRRPEFTARMDANYWQPHIRNLVVNGLNARFQTTAIGKLVDPRTAVVSGDHVRASRGEQKGYDLDSPYEYYETAGFTETGYDTARIKRCSENAHKRLKYTEVQQRDILISCAGLGGVGQARVCFVGHRPGESCTGDVFILRAADTACRICLSFPEIKIWSRAD